MKRCLTLVLVGMLAACSSSGGGSDRKSSSNDEPVDTLPAESTPTPTSPSTLEPTPEPTPEASPEPTPEPAPEPTDTTGAELDGPSDFTSQPWEQGLTGLWDISLDPSIGDLIASFTGLTDASEMMAPGGKWIIVDLGDRIATSSCDTSAPVGAFWVESSDTGTYGAEEFALNFPDSPSFDTLRAMMATAEFVASMQRIDENTIEVTVKVTKPIPMDIIMTATRSTSESPSVQIGHVSADTLSGGTGCSYAQGAGESDFTLHLVTFYEDNFLRLRFENFGIGASITGANLDSPSMLAQHDDTAGINEVSVQFSDDTSPSISFDFVLNAGDTPSIVGNVTIPQLIVNP